LECTIDGNRLGLKQYRTKRQIQLKSICKDVRAIACGKRDGCMRYLLKLMRNALMAI